MSEMLYCWNLKIELREFVFSDIACCCCCCRVLHSQLMLPHPLSSISYAVSEWLLLVLIYCVFENGVCNRIFEIWKVHGWMNIKILEMLYCSNLKIELREFVFSNRTSPGAAVASINILCIFKQNIVNCCVPSACRCRVPSIACCCCCHRRWCPEILQPTVSSSILCMSVTM